MIEIEIDSQNGIGMLPANQYSIPRLYSLSRMTADEFSLPATLRISQL
jgi:hypothetical protein